MYEETHGECGDFGEHTKNSFGQRLGIDLRLNKHKNAVARKKHKDWRRDDRQFHVAGEQVKTAARQHRRLLISEQIWGLGSLRENLSVAIIFRE